MSQRAHLILVAVLAAGLVALGLLPACGSDAPEPGATGTTTGTSTAPDEAGAKDGEAPRAGEEPGEDGDRPELCEGLTGTVRTDLPLPSKLGEIVVAAFEPGDVSEEGFPREGVRGVANFAMTFEAGEGLGRPPALEEGAEPEEGPPVMDVGYRLCLDEGTYTVVAFMDANHDTRLWNAGDYHGWVPSVEVPAESRVNLDVVLASKLGAGMAKPGEGHNKPHPE